MFDATQGLIRDAADQRRLIARAGEYGAGWAELERDELRQFLLASVRRVQVLIDSIEISLDLAKLLRWLLGRDADVSELTADQRVHVTTITVPARLKRTGLEMRFVIDGDVSGEADVGLTRILVRAHALRGRLLQDATLSVDEVAREENVSPSYVTRLLRLTFLAPDIVSGILAGRHPPELTARKLMADTRVPLNWSEQRNQLGFA